jgi:hypothetical protein
VSANYTPQTWTDGDAVNTPISAARLSHIETGVAAVDTAAQTAITTNTTNIATNTTAITNEQTARIAGDALAAQKSANLSDLASPSTALGNLGAVSRAEMPYNVKDYGAVGNGTADDTVAIQNTINAAQTAGGGVVYLPPGNYKIAPQVPRTAIPTSITNQGHALSITSSNITIRGAGKYVTKLTMYGYGGARNDAYYQVVSGYVWRGAAIFVAGGASSGAAVTGVVVEDLEIDGTAGYTNNVAFPANTSTGDGWDITHKGVWYQNGTYFGDVIVRRCYIHTFRGEIIYSGGGMNTALVEQCELSDTNGDGHSLACATTSLNNHIHNTAGNGIEDSNSQSINSSMYSGNRIENIGQNGMSLNQQTFSGPFGGVVVWNNYLINCRIGILGYGRKLWVRHNVLVDCGNVSNYRAIQIQTLSGKPLDSVLVENNCMEAVSSNCQVGIIVVDSYSAGITNTIVRNNTVALTTEGIANGVTYLQGYTLPASVTSYGNQAIGTTYEYTNQAAAVDTLLTTTSATTVAKVRPDMLRNYLVYVYYRIVTATTTVALNLTYYDGSGSAQSVALVPSAAQAVGAYTVLPVYITAQGATESQYVTVTATAGTANQIYCSATIKEI